MNTVEPDRRADRFVREHHDTSCCRTVPRPPACIPFPGLAPPIARVESRPRQSRPAQELAPLGTPKWGFAPLNPLSYPTLRVWCQLDVWEQDICTSNCEAAPRARIGRMADKGPVRAVERPVGVGRYTPAGDWLDAIRRQPESLLWWPWRAVVALAGCNGPGGLWWPWRAVMALAGVMNAGLIDCVVG